MKILVTGGAGFVGSILVPRLLEAGHLVRVYDNLMYGVGPLLPAFRYGKYFELWKGDVRDADRYFKATEKMDFVIHLAAIVGYPACKKDEDGAWGANAEGTRIVATNTPQRVPVVFASTGSCYGNLEGICVEDAELKPLTVYSETKAVAEDHIKERDNYLIYRFATGYGLAPRLRLDLMINDFVYQATVVKNLIVYERNFKRTFIHVLDMSRAFEFAVSHFMQIKNTVYNVGSEDMNLTKQDIVDRIKEIVPFYLHYADIGEDEDKRDYAVSYEKIRAKGFETSASLDEAIRTLIRLFRVLDIKNPHTNV